MRRVRLLFAAAFLAALAFPLVATGQEEAARVRVLLVLDTLDRMGDTWGLDGDNMKLVFENAFDKQGFVKDKHYTIDMFTGNMVTPKRVLEYYDKLQVDRN